ncbi:MAG: hypothetical protein ABSF09_12405 [Candidatus Bathyarchaeia archaeon]
MYTTKGAIISGHPVVNVGSQPANIKPPSKEKDHHLCREWRKILTMKLRLAQDYEILNQTINYCGPKPDAADFETKSIRVNRRLSETNQSSSLTYLW